jgi:PD-(D/E)XK endonuclease
VPAATLNYVPDVARNRRTWTDDALATAVHSARSWRGVLRNLGLYQSGPLHVVQREARRLGLDTSHFGSGVRWTDEQLTAALAEAPSWPRLLSSLGMRPESRRAKEKVKARATQLGLSLDHLAHPSRPRMKEPEEASVLAPDVAHLRDAAQSLATAWFLLRGLWPAAPAEPRPYDLLLESPGGVKRVQVKTTTCTASSGSWYVKVARHAGGGDRHNQRLPYRADEVDLFAILDGEFALYLIPLSAIAGRTGICLAPYRQFIVGTAVSMFSRRPRGIKARTGRPSHAIRRAGSRSNSTMLSASATPLAAPHDRGSRTGTDQAPSRPLQAGNEKSAEPPSAASAHDPRWPVDELRAAADKATSWADLLRGFGYKPLSTRPRRALQRELRRHEIDTSHFVGQRTWSDQALIEAAKTAGTWAELLAGLGLSANSSSDSVRSAARRLGLELGNITLGPKTGREAIGIDLSVRPALDHLRRAAPSIAAAWFLLCGRAVSVPCEPVAYDMVVDLPDGLRRVQVKSATSRVRGTWNVRIGHRPDGSPKAADFIPYGRDEVELFFVVDGDLLLHLIPAAAAAGKATLSLRGYEEFIVGDASSLMDSLDPTQEDHVLPQRTAG